MVLLKVPQLDETAQADEPVQTLVPLGFWRFPVRFFDGAFHVIIQRCEKLLEDLVPTLFSYMDSASLMTAGAVCHGWRRLATCDTLWQRILKAEFSIEADTLRPPPQPLMRLWIQMRRTFRSLLLQ